MMTFEMEQAKRAHGTPREPGLALGAENYIGIHSYLTFIARIVLIHIPSFLLRQSAKSFCLQIQCRIGELYSWSASAFSMAAATRCQPSDSGRSRLRLEHFSSLPLTSHKEQSAYGKVLYLFSLICFFFHIFTTFPNPTMMIPHRQPASHSRPHRYDGSSPVIVEVVVFSAERHEMGLARSAPATAKGLEILLGCCADGGRPLVSQLRTERSHRPR